MIFGPVFLVQRSNQFIYPNTKRPLGNEAPAIIDYAFPRHQFPIYEGPQLSPIKSMLGPFVPEFFIHKPRVRKAGIGFSAVKQVWYYPLIASLPSRSKRNRLMTNHRLGDERHHTVQ